MSHLGLIVEYDGTRYHGFQYQKNVNTIQEELERSITKLIGEEVRIRGAGRTDSGVHAKGQVVVFSMNTMRVDICSIVKGLNHYLPDDIAVVAAHLVPPEFDPRRNAVSRVYQYRVLNRRSPSPLSRGTSLWISRSLEVETMTLGAAMFEGEHDFARFAGYGGRDMVSTVRNILKCEIDRQGDEIIFNVEGDAFLTHQVRRMMGSLIDLGSGVLEMDEFENMINVKGQKIANAVAPHGLCLVEVKYADFPPVRYGCS